MHGLARGDAGRGSCVGRCGAAHGLTVGEDSSGVQPRPIAGGYASGYMRPGGAGAPGAAWLSQVKSVLRAEQPVPPTSPLPPESRDFAQCGCGGQSPPPPARANRLALSIRARWPAGMRHRPGLEGRSGRRRDNGRMFTRVLVANRGEIAVRVIRALHELGIEAVAVYSTADEGALHTRLADRAVRIGPPPAAQSYLSIPAIVAAGVTTGCEAGHPGYGFLAESAAFVRACVDNDLVFVGPSAETMERAGDKALAKEELGRVGVPLVPGTEGRTTL